MSELASVHTQVQELFPGFDYHNPAPGVRERFDFRRPDNVTGHQQRAFSCFWAKTKCGPLDLGLDMGSPKGMTPYCVHVDVFGEGKAHPFYGGGRYLSDVVYDASRVGAPNLPVLFPEDSVPLVVANHSLEHMPAHGGMGDVVSLLERWWKLLRGGGVFAAILPDQKHFDVMASDKDHKWAPDSRTFRQLVLDPLVNRTGADLVEYDTLDNHFSFNVVLRKNG
jgi:SAM-dependent methyltransferase